MSVEAAQFRDAMGRTAAGVTIVTTDGAAGRAGLTVSSLCSLSLEPASILFCVHAGSRSLPAFIDNGVFAASVLAHDQQQVSDSFAGLVPEFRDDRFRAGEWDVLQTGAPVLRGALCRFDCRIVGSHEFGTHRIILGEVIALDSSAGEPLVYAHRSYHRLAAA